MTKYEKHLKICEKSIKITIMAIVSGILSESWVSFLQ